MAQFISSNPVTETIARNEARVRQQEQADLQMQNAREQQAALREQRALVKGADERQRGIANIFAEPQAAPTPVPDELGGGPPAPTAIRSFGDKTRDAVKFAAASPGGGADALRMSQDLQKRQDAAQVQALAAIRSGDYEAAGMLNKQHGLGMDSVLANPNARNVATNLAKSIPAKLEPMQAIAFQDAAATEFGRVFSESKSHAQAYEAAGRAGMLAAGKVRPKGDKYVESPKGYFDPAAGDYVKDPSGKVVMPPDRRLSFGTSGGPGGGSGGASKGAKFDIDADGNRVILYRDGTMVYPKDAQGNPVRIKSGTDQDEKFRRQYVLGEAKKSFTPDENPVATAQRLAQETKTGAPASALPPGIPANSKQVGTAGGKPVYQDSNGKRYVVE